MPLQQDLISKKFDTFIQAGAGAGKTFGLTRHVLQVIEQILASQHQPRIAICTFTRKATQELKERLVLAAFEEKKLNLLPYITSRSHLHISTIHGVLSIFLTRYGSRMGLDPGFTMVGAEDEVKQAKRILKKILVEQNALNLLEVYSFQELSHYAIRYFSQKVHCREFCATDKKSFEWNYQAIQNELLQSIENFRSLVKKEESSESADWKLFLSQLEKLAHDLKSSELQDWFDGSDEKEFKKPNQVKKINKVSAPVLQACEEVIQAIEAFLSDVQPPHLWEKHLERQNEFKKVADVFTEKFLQVKLSQGTLTSNDLEILTAYLIQEHPDTAISFSQDWDYWLLDEFQDTSPLQLKILSQLIRDRSAYYVGDPQQSIYLFRGSDERVFLQQKLKIQEAQKSKSGLLEIKKENHRSYPETLEFINDLFSDLGFLQMEAVLPKDYKINPKKKVAKFFEAQSKTEEMNAVAGHIQELLKSGVSAGEICVLSKSNDVIAKFGAALSDCGVPTYVEAAAGFSDRREILDALSLLKFFINPYDNHNLIHLFRSPWLRIEDGQLMELIRPSRVQSSHWNCIKEHTEISTVQKLIHYQTKCRELGITQTFKQALIELGFFDLCRLHDATGRREANLWKLVTRLTQEEHYAGFSYAKFIFDNETAMGHVDDESSEQDAVAAVAPDRVNLMTIHKSKGLEFKHVIIPRIHANRAQAERKDFLIDEAEAVWALPYVCSDGSKQHVIAMRSMLAKKEKATQEEMLRILYVAVTRAIDSLFFTWESKRIQGSSWLRQLKLDLSEGLHEKDQYCYEVLTEATEPSVSNLNNSHSSKITKKVEMLSIQNFMERYTVTEILQKQKNAAMVTAGVAKVKTTGALLDGMLKAEEGVRAHRLFEGIKYGLELKEMLKWFGLKNHAEVEKAYQEVLNYKTVPIKKIIENGFVEWGFLLKESDGILEGQIDLWGEVDGITWIVDYKTGSPKYMQDAFEQLRLYARAVQIKSGSTNIKLAVIYPFSMSHSKIQDL